MMQVYEIAMSFFWIDDIFICLLLDQNYLPMPFEALI